MPMLRQEYQDRVRQPCISVLPLGEGVYQAIAGHCSQSFSLFIPVNSKENGHAMFQVARFRSLIEQHLIDRRRAELAFARAFCTSDNRIGARFGEQATLGRRSSRRDSRESTGPISIERVSSGKISLDQSQRGVSCALHGPRIMEQDGCKKISLQTGSCSA